MSEPACAEFSDPRLVALYDAINPLGDAGAFSCRLAESLSARTIIDLGCGTGLLAVELAKRGHDVTGIDPSEAMLAVARAKPFAERVKWGRGSFERMQGLQADMVLMTSHVAQFFLDEEEWRAMLQAAHGALRAGGHLVFDVRRLSDPPFAGWPTEDDRRIVETAASGTVEWWFRLLGVEGRRVRYELHYRFVGSGEHVVSGNELVFRSQDDVTAALSDVGFETRVVHGDWDGSLATSTSPEMVFVAVRS